MDPSSQFIVPTIIDVPELIVTNEDTDFDDTTGLSNSIWFSKLQFLASALPYTIGLGTIWRFPHLCYKHAGGAFLAAYTLALITIGLPLFLMELAFGQYANEGPITIWRISPAFEGIGYAMCLISAMVAIYYNIINAWLIHYLFASLTFGSLPWSTCDNSWNSDHCFLKSDEENLSVKDITNVNKVTSPPNCTYNTSTIDIDGKSLPNNSLLLLGDCATINSFEFDKIINTTNEVTLPANEYFHRNVLSISESLSEMGALNWDVLFGLMLAWAIIFIIILKNLRLPNRFTVIGLIMPYFVLTALFMRALTLPGSSKGIAYYFKFEWSRMQNIDIWADATTQIFFSLSPCWGGIITLANMNKFHNNFHASATLIVLINYATSLFVGLVAFTIVGYMSTYSGIAIDEVVDEGLGFVFMVYTEALAQVPFSSFNSIIFFAMMLFLGFTSQLTVIETVIKTIVDTWPHKLRYRRPLVIMVLCAVMFILGLTMCFGNGFYVVELLDGFAGTHTAMIVGILELIAIAWVYGMENFMQDIDDMISLHRNLFPSRQYWYFMWRYLTPSALFAILIFCFTDLKPIIYRGQSFPESTLKFGWFLTFGCTAIIPAIAFIRFLLSPSGSFIDKISYLCRPSEDWAPSSYVSGPKLIGRHVLGDEDLDDDLQSRSPMRTPYTDQDQDSNESNEDLKVVDGKANYIIPEEEDDTDTGLITNETNV